jgi:hypothetical protein
MIDIEMQVVIIFIANSIKTLSLYIRSSIILLLITGFCYLLPKIINKLYNLLDFHVLLSYFM